MVVSSGGQVIRFIKYFVAAPGKDIKMFKQFLVIIFISLEGVTLAGDVRLPESAVVLENAKRYVQNLNSIDYQFTTSLYQEHVQRFRSLSILTRFDAELPTARPGGDTDYAGFVYAFDGERYQTFGYLSEAINHSRSRPDSNMIGPCWTPMELAYLWLSVANADFSWELLRDDDVWNGLSAILAPSLTEHQWAELRSA